VGRSVRRDSVTLSPVILQEPGFLSAAHRTDDHTFTGVAGKGYPVDVQGISNNLDPGGSLDVIVAIQPDGTQLSSIDTGTNETSASSPRSRAPIP